MKPCRYCDGSVARDATVCPRCGAKNRDPMVQSNPLRKMVVLMLFATVIVGFVWRFSD